MIQNERQYEITTKWIARFEESLEALRQDWDKGDDNDRAWRRIHEAAMTSQVETLRAQLAEYDDLRAGRVQVMPFASLRELPGALTKARIASGISQREIADRLGIEEERFIREEGRGYQSMSIAQLREIAAALGVELHGDLRLSGSHVRAAV